MALKVDFEKPVMEHFPKIWTPKNGKSQIFEKKGKIFGKKVDFSKSAKTPQKAGFDTFLTFSKKVKKLKKC